MLERPPLRLTVSLNGVALLRAPSIIEGLGPPPQGSLRHLSRDR